MDTRYTWKKIATGLYGCVEHPEYEIMKDGYSSVREAHAEWKKTVGADARLGGFRFDGIEFEPEEACWILMIGETNLTIEDTLREAKRRAEFELPRDLARRGL